MNNKHALFHNKSMAERLFVWGAFIVTVFLSLVPFFKVGFTTSDDVQYFVTAQQGWDYWMMDHEVYAQYQGRFYFLLTKCFYYVPYLCDNFLATKLIQYSTLLACYALFSYLVCRIVRSRALAMLTMLLLVFNTCITRSGLFIAVTAYPFYFSFSFMLFLLGILLYVNYYQKGGMRTTRRHRLLPIWGSMLFFVSALFYENYLTFVALVTIYILLRHWRRDGLGFMWRNKALYREVVPPLLAAVTYTAIYVGYRQWIAATMPEIAFYNGATLSEDNGFSISSLFRLITRCTLIALPGQSYFIAKQEIANNSILLGGHRNSPLFILLHASPIVIVNALLQSILFAWLCCRVDFRRLSWHKLLAVLAGALVFAFAANLLLALTPKYQDWSRWLRGYVTSFYSYFGVALAMAIMVAATLKTLKNIHIFRIVCGLWALLVFFLAVLIGYSNEHLSREWQQSQNRFVAIDAMAKEGAFDNLPDDALLYTEGLHRLSHTAYFICEGTNDIENYISLRAGRKFQYAIDSAQLADRLAENPDQPLVLVNAIASKKYNELLVSLSLYECVDTLGTRTLNRAQLYYLSPAKQFTLFYQADSLWHSLPVAAEHPRHKVTPILIEAPNIDPTSFYISDMLPEEE